MTKDEEKKAKRFIKECGLYEPFRKRLYGSSGLLAGNYKSYREFVKCCKSEEFISSAFAWDLDIWMTLNLIFRYGLN